MGLEWTSPYRMDRPYPLISNNPCENYVGAKNSRGCWGIFVFRFVAAVPAIVKSTPDLGQPGLTRKSVRSGA